MRIRDATPSDASRLATLLDQLGYPSTREQTTARLERLLADRAARVVVAELDGGVVGLAVTYVEPLLEHDEPACRLQALAVDELHRRKGIATQLVRAVEDEARARGCSTIVLTSADRRADAHAFYLSAGFEQTGRRFAKPV